MKNILIIIFTGFVFVSNSQNDTVEKSIFGIQTGFLGLWVNNEARLSSPLALRTELGLDAGVFGNEIYKKRGFILVPTMTLEPRLYYNLSKRNSESKITKGNNGNFISIKTTYHPDLFVISN